MNAMNVLEGGISWQGKPDFEEGEQIW